MQTLLYVVHALICLALILLILLQQGKGAGVGFSMGGASQTMFGGSGGRDFFIKLTSGLALAFVLICVILAKLATSNAGQYRGVLSGVETPAAPAPLAPLGDSAPAGAVGGAAPGAPGSAPQSGAPAAQ
jgi:preprotein translocase subunit SecG